jgi:DNA-directed RNA polymerase beta' subunit
VGRALFNRIVPGPAALHQQPLDKGDLQDLIALCYRRMGREAAVDFADAIKAMGFRTPPSPA